MVNNPLNFFSPQIIEKINSPINGEIQVIKQLGDTKIVVNKMLQSGGLVELIWKKGIKQITNFQLPISKVLILGLGGGSAVKLVNQYYPQAKITGIEIDPVMIKLANKYFNVDKIKNLKIICQDAIKYINNQQFQPKAGPATWRETINNFDLILIDLYLGDLIPQKSYSVNFLKQLYKIMSKDGTIIINCLFYGKHKIKTEKVIQEAGKVFSSLKLIRAWSNLLVVLRK